MELRLLALYPEQMNIYADRGNIIFLQRRCEWRGIGFGYAAAGPGERFDPAAHDFIYIGGGQDRDQRAVAADMVESKREALAEAAGDGAVLDGLRERLALGLEHVGGDDHLVAILAAADVDQVVGAWIEALPWARGGVGERDPAPLAAALEKDDVSAVGIDVHLLGIEGQQPQLTHRFCTTTTVEGAKP